jgi:hypothetical protein
MKEKTKKIRDSYINIRCYAEDKMYAEERAKNGYGKGKHTISNFVLYAMRHVDDASPISIDKVKNLVHSIGENRQPLAAIHQSIVNFPREINAVGNNINQIAKSCNSLLLKAKKEGKTTEDTIINLLSYQSALIIYLNKIISIMEEYSKPINAARINISTILRKEDEILTRCLVFPKESERGRKLSQLMRMIQDYQHEANIHDEQSIGDLKMELQTSISEAVNE